MKYLFLALLFCASYFVKSQEYSESSYYNLSIGIGPNYGMIGTKSIIGYKHSGLLVGLGVVAGQLTYELGGQLGIGPFYFNAGYGFYEHSSSPVQENFAEGVILNMGVNKHVSKGDPFFLNLGIGYSFGGQLPVGESFRDANSINVAAGIGYQFGKKRIQSKKPDYITL